MKKYQNSTQNINISSKDLENIYRIVGKNKQIVEITLLISNVTKEVLYTFDKVYKKEFQ